MIAARVKTASAAQARVLLVLSAENVAQLQDGQLIHIAKTVLEPLGIKGLTLDLRAGTTDEANAAALREKQNIHPLPASEA